MLVLLAVKEKREGRKEGEKKDEVPVFAGETNVTVAFSQTMARPADLASM